MSDVWKIGQENSASKFYETHKDFRFAGIGGNHFAVSMITHICNAMAESYDQTIDEQAEYLTEIEELNQEIEELKLQLEEEIETRNKENENLVSQQNEDGTLTTDASEKINANNSEIEGLETQFGSLINAKSAEVEAHTNSAKNVKSKEKIAKDYGETAIEKGQPLVETKDKRKSFWRKLTGSWDKSGTRELGQKAVDAGNNLLEKVNVSAEISNEINKKSKVSK